MSSYWFSGPAVREVILLKHTHTFPVNEMHSYLPTFHELASTATNHSARFVFSGAKSRH